MMNYIKNSLFIIFIIVLFIYKGIFINIFTNINSLFKSSDDIYNVKIELLNKEIQTLNDEITTITNLKNIEKTNFILTKLSYRKTYSDNNFYINGEYEENSYLINEKGLVGIVTKKQNGYSECITLKGITNLSIKINNSYGTLKEYKDGYFITDNFSNYANINLQDSVYTTEYGSNKYEAYIGYVYSIEKGDIENKIIIKSNVEFDNISYLYVVNK